MGSKNGIPRALKCEIGGVLLLAFTILLFLALVSDGYQSRVRRPLDGIAHVQNALGTPGAAVAGVLCLAVGGAAHVLYAVLGLWGLFLLRHRTLDRLPARLAGLLLMVAGVAAMVHVDFPADSGGAPAGGLVGGFLGGLVLGPFGAIGANVIGITMALIGLVLSTDFLLLRFFGFLAQFSSTAARAALALARRTGRGCIGLVRSALTRLRTSRTAPAPAAEPEELPAVLDEEGVYLENGVGSPLFDDDQEPLHTPQEEAPSIRFHGATEQSPDPVASANTDGADSPFDEVPALDEAVADAAQAPELPEGMEEEVFGEDECPVLFAVADPEPSASDGSQRDSVNKQAQDDAPASPKKQTASGAKRRPPLPRRKTAADLEVPPDYEYPKRYTRPSLDMFEQAPTIHTPDLTEQLRKTSRLLEEKLATFNIEARVTDITRGPTITRFELEPAPGVKVSRFSSLVDDLALALKARGIRIEAPIPGKGRVGIEVPNREREPVLVRGLLESSEFKKDDGALTLALGKDIAGEVMCADLAAMPHLLVAGATGSGKTVCVKTMLASLLATKTPDELQLMLVDPKMVELSIFEGIPHLITPVVIDPKKAASSLSWLITEMEERYRLFAHLRVRNIEVYNESVENGEIEMAETEDGESESVESIRKLPYIVCIIDELADLMMQARAEVEDAIARLAQLARAVGIHLIIATQRPSVDVLTGVIKSNFPARISFQVSSKVDSRCILDSMGAERLIGKGDMLYLPPGRSKPARIQGAFVSDGEMETLIAYLKTQAPPQYRDEIEQFGKSSDVPDGFDDEEDELLEDAIRVVLETGQASISMVQRRLRVGYTRAARLIDMMEMRGIVGPHIGSKAREILVDCAPDGEVA